MTHPLNADDIEVVGDCLRAIAAGPFLEEWEFSTVMGVERSAVASLARAWPNANLGDPRIVGVVQNALNNLIGFPHNTDISIHVRGGVTAVERVLSAMRSERDARPVNRWQSEAG